MPLVWTPMSVTLVLKTRTLAVPSQTVNLLPQLVIIILVMVRVLAMVVIVNMIMVIVTTVVFVIFSHHLVFSSVPGQ